MTYCQFNFYVLYLWEKNPLIFKVLLGFEVGYVYLYTFHFNNAIKKRISSQVGIIFLIVYNFIFFNFNYVYKVRSYFMHYHFFYLYMY